MHWVADIPVDGDWELSLFCKTAGGEERRNRIPADQKIVLTKQTNIFEIEPNQTITAFNVTVTAKNAGNTLRKCLSGNNLPENAISGNYR